MLGILLVNGAATLASPILTMGNSSNSKSSNWAAIVAAEPATCDTMRANQIHHQETHQNRNKYVIPKQFFSPSALMPYQL
jgi:hypothetical protein